VAEEELGQDEDEPRQTMEEQEDDLVKQQEDEPRPTMEEEEDDLVKQQEQEEEEEDDLVKQPRLELGQEDEDDLVKQPRPEEELLGPELCAVSFWAPLTFRGWSLPTVSRRRHKEVAHGSI